MNSLPPIAMADAIAPTAPAAAPNGGRGETV